MNYTDYEKNIQKLYKKVSKIRECQSGFEDLKNIFDNLKKDLSQEWLLILEVFELSKSVNLDFSNEVKDYLIRLSHKRKDFKKLITDGLRLS